MNILDLLKIDAAIRPVTTDNGAYTGIEIDTQDCEALMVVVMLGNVPANVAALKVTESDTSGGSFTDVSGADFSVSPLTLPAASGGDNTIVGVTFNDMGPRKRYLKLAATAGNGSGTGTALAAFVIKARLREAPSSTSERGLDQHAFV